MKEIIFLAIGMLIGIFLTIFVIANGLDDRAEEICKDRSFPSEEGWFEIKSLRVVCQNLETYYLKRYEENN